ncbi:hypothetical protein CDAR_254191 [Caerostris darwini]|uniref:Uncharacterized protein n=1 Tax=Caerostris darwini TaxID=1538125 RepID=A0AAV4TYE4_9ARAC|nr:hypothetical protein CDAR_254191 [Caerostris darwini]
MGVGVTVNVVWKKSKSWWKYLRVDLGWPPFSPPLVEGGAWKVGCACTPEKPPQWFSAKFLCDFLFLPNLPDSRRSASNFHLEGVTVDEGVWKKSKSWWNYLRVG